MKSRSFQKATPRREGCSQSCRLTASMLSFVAVWDAPNQTARPEHQIRPTVSMVARPSVKLTSAKQGTLAQCVQTGYQVGDHAIHNRSWPSIRFNKDRFGNASGRWSCLTRCQGSKTATMQ